MVIKRLDPPERVGCGYRRSYLRATVNRGHKISKPDRTTKAGAIRERMSGRSARSGSAYGGERKTRTPSEELPRTHGLLPLAPPRRFTHRSKNRTHGLRRFARSN